MNKRFGLTGTNVLILGSVRMAHVENPATANLVGVKSILSSTVEVGLVLRVRQESLEQRAL